MVFRLSPTAGHVVPRALARLLAGLMALSLTGNPGVTGAAPTLHWLCNGLALMGGAALLWQRGWIPRPRLTVAALLLAMFGLLSCTNSLAPHLSAAGAASLSGMVAAVLILELGVHTRSQWQEAATLFFLVAVGSSLHGLVLWSSSASESALTSTFTNQDCYSVIPLLATFWALGLAVEQRGPWRLPYVLGLVVLISALILTASRAGLLALAVGYAGFLFTLAASRSVELRNLAAKLFLIPTVALLALMAAGGNLQLVQKWERLARGEDPVAIKSRLDVVRYGYKSIARHPLLGCGLGCFSLSYQQDRPPLAEGEDYMNVAHNDYVQWMVEAGVPGGLAWMSLLLASLAVVWRSYRSPTPWVAAQIAATLGVATYCTLNFACPVPADLLWIGASFGLSGGLSSLSRSEAQASAWSPKAFPVAVLLAAWGLWTVRWGLTSLMMERARHQVIQSEAVLDWESAVEFLRAAGRKQPDNFQVQLKIAELCRRAFVFSGKSHWLDEQSQALLNAHEASPRDLQILLSLIRFCQERGQFLEAERYLDMAQGYAPYSSHVRRAQARNQILSGQYVEATRTLSSVERTGLVADDSALADLIFLLESKAPARGTTFLVEIARADSERATLLGLQAAARGQQIKDFSTSLRILKQLRNLAPQRMDVLLEIALARGAAGDTDQELAVLNKMRRDTSGLDPSLAERVWRRWSELQVARGELDLVVTQLEDYVITHQRQAWARQTVSDVFLKRGQKSEARGALRDGLPYDQDGSLRIRLGDLCAEQGLTELARGYYREALAISPQRPLIEERLRQLKSSPQEELEDLQP
ncbi:O-antigen ligase family protein [bacterium]|nr:O-antigen ligase family protein [bacterium]